MLARLVRREEPLLINDVPGVELNLMVDERFGARFLKCLVAYSVLFGWKLAYKGLTGEDCFNGLATQAFSIFLLTLFQFYIPPANLNPIGSWVELASGARSFSSALSSTISSFVAAAAVMQLFLSTIAHSQINSIAVPHAGIHVGGVFLHVVFTEAFLSLSSVLFANQLIRKFPAFAAVPSFVITNALLLFQLQTPLMSTLGNVNPASAVASVFLHQQPVVTITQILGNVLAVSLFGYANDLLSNRSLRQKTKQD